MTSNAAETTVPSDAPRCVMCFNAITREPILIRIKCHACGREPTPGELLALDDMDRTLTSRSGKDRREGRVDEAVDHPSHYGGADDPFEHVKVAEAKGWVENAFLYNATKYLWRFGRKSRTTPVEDLRKAIWYLNRLVQHLEKTP